MARPMQPLLHDETVVLRAPTQAWSAADGSMGSRPIHGVYFGDVRLIQRHALTVDGATPEHIATSPDGPSSVTFDALLRQLDGPGADPDVQVSLHRTVQVDGVTETITVTSRLPHPLTLDVRLDLELDSSAMDAVKSGTAAGSEGAAVRI